MPRFVLVGLAAIGALWTSLACAQRSDLDQRPALRQVVTPKQADQLVRSIRAASQEFSRNSTCFLVFEQLAGSACAFHRVRVSCTPAKNDNGMVQTFFVNKANAAVIAADTKSNHPIA